jgi:glycogen operon protein
MLLGGDEIGRTQGGNNNAYCQDNEISRYDWEHADLDLLAFTRQLIAFRQRHPVFRRRGWFKGRPIKGTGVVDIAWFKPDGLEMTEQDWSDWCAKSFSVFLNGDAVGSRDDDGRKVRDHSFLLLSNAHTDAVTFTLPSIGSGRAWMPELDTADPRGFVERATELPAGGAIDRPGLSLLVLCRR